MMKTKLFLGSLIAAVAVVGVPTAATATPHPASAQNCDGDPSPGSTGAVCLFVNGSGLHVDSMRSGFEWYQHTGCQNAVFTVSPAQHTELFPFRTQVCGTSTTKNTGNINININLRNNTNLCVQWNNKSIKECIKVHT